LSESLWWRVLLLATYINCQVRHTDSHRYYKHSYSERPDGLIHFSYLCTDMTHIGPWNDLAPIQLVRDLRLGPVFQLEHRLQ